MSSQDANQIEFDFLSDLPVLVQQHEGQLTSEGVAIFLGITLRMPNKPWPARCHTGPSDSSSLMHDRGPISCRVV
jgi:hypothetical protein